MLAIERTRNNSKFPMYMFGFTDEVLSVAFSLLLENKALGIAYVTMSESRYVL